MAITAALAKKLKLNAFHRRRPHKVCKENSVFKRHPNSKLFRTNSYSANGKSICRRIQHSRLFNTTSTNGIGNSNPNPLYIAKDPVPLSVSVERMLGVRTKSHSAGLDPKQTILYQCEILDSKNFQHESDKVEETIKLFRKVLFDLKRKNIGNNNRTSDYTEAAGLLRKQRKWLNLEKRLGTIPGIRVYKEFQYRAELRIIGLHCQFIGGIDYVEINGEILATSIVDSGRYFSKTEGSVESLEFLYYYGAGGNPSVQKTQPKDQRLVRGNLALYNSMRRKSSVRVIRKIHEFPEQSSKFVYEGLFIVVSCQQVREKKYGKLVFEFILRREKEKRNPIRSKSCL